MGKYATDAYVIGDTQVKPGVRNPLVAVAYDIIETRPTWIIHIGDHHDLPSLSPYDQGKHSFYDMDYVADIEAGNIAFEEFWGIIEIGKLQHPEWQPKFIFCEGNHENRRHKALDTAPKIYRRILEDHKPNYEGWDKVVPFLKPFELNGVNFVHYIANEFTGKPISTARTALSRKHKSFVCGHKQTLDYAEEPTLNGKRIMGLIIGACYYHQEKYKGPQGNNHFRGVAYLRNIYRGEWEMEIRHLLTLAEKYK